MIERIGAVAYHLKLPDSSSIHPVFHVSLLKRAVGTNHQVSSELPANPGIVQVPIKILQRRVQMKGDHTRSQVLVQWSSWPPALATWEDEALLRTRFPSATAWGQAVTEEEGDVTAPNQADPLSRTSTHTKAQVEAHSEAQPQAFRPRLEVLIDRRHDFARLSRDKGTSSSPSKGQNCVIG